MRQFFWMALLWACSARFGVATESRVIDSMDALDFQAPKEKAKVELVDGKDGKALKFSFENDCKGAFCIGKAKGAADWDAAAGISFWVKGDGSEHLGGIEFIWDNNFALRFAYAFPIDGTDWKKIVVPWRDLIPETSGPAAKPLGRDGLAPSKLGPIWFGKWWYWRDYAAHSYSIDEIRLEPVIELGTEPAVPSAPFDHVLAKLKAGKPVTIVTMGDSLTDFNHWANKPVNWPTLLKEKLHAKYSSEVTLINPAMGGTELRQNLMLIPRWLRQAPEPDLVTIWFGFNDWNSGMRGEMFAQTMQDAIDRVRRATNGNADVLVMTTCPAVEKWDTVAELAQAARTAAHARHAGVADMYTVFHEEGKTDREHLYCRGKVHLGPAGHELVANAILDSIDK
ncbi:MAG TPA: GDSL-type esterase/lipase family protein [Planctomycetota bacterium]|nr:GDSL-type esterase/lipase family protein [Planctomycetota bacterium]